MTKTNSRLRQYARTQAVLVMAVCLVLCLSPALGRAADPMLRTVALSGQIAPGTDGAGKFEWLGASPSINASGQTAFVGRLRLEGAVNVRNSSGIWSEGSGSLALVARERDPAPGLPNGIVFGPFAQPAISDPGQIVFWSTLSSSLAPNVGSIWSEINGQLELVAHNGNPSRGFPPETYDRSPHSYLRLSNEGIVISAGGRFEASSEIRRASGDEMEVVVRAGDPAPGASGHIFKDFDYPAVGANGDMTFRAALQPNGPSGATGARGIWSERDGILSLLAREGSQAPDAPSGVRFSYLGDAIPSISGAGDVAFAAPLTGTGVTSRSDSGIWASGDGEPRLVVREGDAAPGFSGHRFQGFPGPVLIDDNGQTAFFASMLPGQGVPIIDSGFEGLWMERDGELKPIVRSQTQAPGMPDGVVFRIIPFNSTFELNDAGRIAIWTSMRGPGVDSSNNVGIWAEDVAGVLRLIVRKGDVLEVAPGDFRTVSGLAFRGVSPSSTDRYQGSGFNNAGQIAFFAGFTDGSRGIFVSNLATLPEPSATLLAGVAAAVATARLRRRTSMS